MADKGKAALTGAATGAAAGSVLGPWGAAGGAVIGGALGYFGADDTPAPTYTPDQANFKYGLGPSDGYASEQSRRYDQEIDRLSRAGWEAQFREAPQQAMPTQRDFVASQGQDYLANAGADARQRQIAALGGIEQSNRQLSNFAAQKEGPSAAQAQLQQATNQAISQQNAMARTQRGGGGAALRNAAFNSAGLQSQANAASAQLRAQEAQGHRAQQLQALGAVQQGAGLQANYTGQLRGADTGLAQSQAGQANYDAQSQNTYNQFQQGQEFQMGANNLNAQLQNQGQADAFTQGMLGQAGQYYDRTNQVAQAQSNMGVAYEQARAAGAGIGSNNFNAAADRGLQETGMMLGAVSGAAGAMGQMGGGQAASGYNPGSNYTVSDVRAKQNIRPAEVARALGGKSPREAWDAYDREQALANVRAQVGEAQDFRSLQTSPIDRSTDEFAPRVRSGRELGMRRPNVDTLRALGAGPKMPVSEVTELSPEEEQSFQRWASKNNVTDVDHPDSHYDYRGFWKDNGGQKIRGGVDHFPDTYKQHGHETFSEESRYSRGPGDGGTWEGDDFRPAAPYLYEYKDPERHGEGAYVGPMAQDLEHLPGVVEQSPDGTKAINAPRLSLATAGAVSEQQRRLDQIEQRQRMMLALGGPRPAYPMPVQPGGL